MRWLGLIAISLASVACQLDWDALVGDGGPELLDGGGTDGPPVDARIDAGPPTADEIALGGHHSCAIRAGELVCWGRNDLGQLGIGNNGPVATPRAVDLAAPVRQVSAGYLHTCAIDESGDLYCWGDSDSGKLGIAPTGDVHAPQQVPLSGAATHVSAGVDHTCATNDGFEVYCWGAGNSGSVGPSGPSTTPVGVPMPAGFQAVEVAVGYGHSCARSSDDRVACWGSDEQRGDGLGGQTSTPVLANVAEAAKLVSGWEHVCVRRRDGAIECWGDGWEGELGDGMSHATSAPVRLSGLPEATDLSAGGHHTCVVAGGMVWCWGRGRTGQLGREADSRTPVSVAGTTGAQRVAAGGTLEEGHTCALDGSNVLTCWGYRAWGQLADDFEIVRPEPVRVADPTSRYAVGAGHGCAARATGVSCAGRNGAGQAGVPGYAPVALPMAVSGVTGPTALGLGARHSCAIHETSLACWGAGESRQLGNDSTTARSPVPMTVVDASTGAAWMAVTAGRDHTCGLRDDGAAHCWGQNRYGQLGRETSTPYSGVPVLVTTPEDVVEIGAGDAFSCARMTSGNVVCWGRDDAGQLGDGTTVAMPGAVVAVSDLSGVERIAVGRRHACAISAGAARCWGENVRHQVDATTDDADAPGTVITGASAVVDLALGAHHSCMLLSDGGVWCWGGNQYGQLGRGTLDAGGAAPERVAAIDAATGIAAYDYQTCALTAEGVYCWGLAAEGRIADGTPLHTTVPMVPRGLW